MNFVITNDVATICIDDGKANVFGPSLVEELPPLLERAKTEAKAVVFTGRGGMFSAGFDLKALQKGPEIREPLLAGGMAILEKVYSHPQPVIAACDGHAIGMGAFLLLASDIRLGSDNDYNVTLPETAIGMPFTPVLMTLIRERLSNKHKNIAVLTSKPHAPAEAQGAGFLDQVVSADALLATAQAMAEGLAQMSAETYAANKLDLRSESLAVMRADLA